MESIVPNRTGKSVYIFHYSLTEKKDKSKWSSNEKMKRLK